MLKLRIIPWLFGVALILTTLAGANCLMQPTDPASAGGGAPQAPKAAPPSTGEGLIAKGTVTSDPPTFPVTLPAHLAAGTVSKIHVKSGQSVKAGEPLISFDDTLLKSDYARALAAHQVVFSDYQQAIHKLEKSFPITIAGANLAHERAIKEHERTKETYKLARQEMKDRLVLWRDPNSNAPYTPQQIDQRLNDDPVLSNLQGLVDAAGLQVRNANNELKKAEDARDLFQKTVEQAANRANNVKAEVDKALQAVKDCVIIAKLPGTVEQVSAAEGQTVYPQSKPLCYFVPAGPRMVHAEIVPDFAHRIKDRVGQPVQISDDSNTNLLYKGVVKRVPAAFLPKPSGAPDLINGKSNLVLIVEIEITDANPKDLPPLRVGQPVRVIFP